MFSSLAIHEIITKWRDELLNNPAINDFCQTKYGTHPKIFIGVDPNALPAQSDCPYILIHSGSKTEGMNRKEYRYLIPVEWSISNTAKTVSGQVTELDGLYDMDAFGQLILTALMTASPSSPISYLNYSTLREETFPQFTGRMEVKVSIFPAMGESISY